jgi:5-formyltetrahydrofolate cyclo-ligase
MNMEERVARINALARKAKSEGLTEEEKQEQAILRREYIDSIKGNLDAQLKSIRIQNPDGTLSPLQKKKKEVPVSLQKVRLRKEVLERRDAMSEELRREADALLKQRILEHEWFEKAERVLAFFPNGSEVGITELLEECLKAGKALYLPKVKGKELNFYRIEELTDLEPGFRGIMEPKGDSAVYFYNEETAKQTPEQDLLIMPGVAFDSENGRIGYGGGYYDRFLTDKETLRNRSVGVGYACQMVEQIPVEDTDIRPCLVITV